MIEYKKDLTNIVSDQLSGFFVGWKQPLSKEKHYQILKNSEYIILAFDTREEKVVGFVNALSDEVRFAFIPMLEVLPEYQNRGIGTKLMEILLSDLENISNIDLTCDPELQNFYERFGMLKSRGMVIRKYLE